MKAYARLEPRRVVRESQVIAPGNACRSRIYVAGLFTYLLVDPIPRESSYPVEYV